MRIFRDIDLGLSHKAPSLNMPILPVLSILEEEPPQLDIFGVSCAKPI